MTKIITCTCKHEYQDKLYGDGKRVANLTKESVKDSNVYRCTVCKRETNK